MHGSGSVIIKLIRCPLCRSQSRRCEIVALQMQCVMTDRQMLNGMLNGADHCWVLSWSSPNTCFSHLHKPVARAEPERTDADLFIDTCCSKIIISCSARKSSVSLKLNLIVLHLPPRKCRPTRCILSFHGCPESRNELWAHCLYMFWICDLYSLNFCCYT